MIFESWWGWGLGIKGKVGDGLPTPSWDGNNGDVILDIWVEAGHWSMLQITPGITLLWTNPERTSSRTLKRLLPSWWLRNQKNLHQSLSQQSQWLSMWLLSMRKFISIAILFSYFYSLFPLRGFFDVVAHTSWQEKFVGSMCHCHWLQDPSPFSQFMKGSKIEFFKQISLVC